MVAALAAWAVLALPAQAGSPGPADHPSHTVDAPTTERSATFALFVAATSGTAEEVKAALDAGASVNGYTWKNSGRTALHYAADKNSGEVVGLLLDAGADPMARDSHGRVPMDYAGNNAALVGTDAYRRLGDATAWGRCLEQMGDRDACSALRGLAAISEELSATQEVQQEAEACEVENWSHQYMFNTIFISGTTTCESGDMRLQVFDGSEFLGGTLAPVVKSFFSVSFDVSRRPAKLIIKTN